MLAALTYYFYLFKFNFVAAATDPVKIIKSNMKLQLRCSNIYGTYYMYLVGKEKILVCK